MKRKRIEDDAWEGMSDSASVLAFYRLHPGRAKKPRGGGSGGGGSGGGSRSHLAALRRADPNVLVGPASKERIVRELTSVGVNPLVKLDELQRQFGMESQAGVFAPILPAEELFRVLGLSRADLSMSISAAMREWLVARVLAPPPPRGSEWVLDRAARGLGGGGCLRGELVLVRLPTAY